MKTIFTLITLLLLSTPLFAQQKVSPFALPQMNATPIGTLYDSALVPGGVWVLENYFQSCSYCNENAPKVNALADFYKDNIRVHVIDLGIDTRDNQYAAWISAHSSNHPVLKDSARTLTNQLGTTGYPTTYLVNCQYEVIYTHVGTWDTAMIQAMKDAISQALLETACYL